MNFQTSGQKIKTKKHAKYLNIIIDENLSFKKHMESVNQKIKQATGLLAKLRHYVSVRISKSVYFALFDSPMRYGC